MNRDVSIGKVLACMLLIIFGMGCGNKTFDTKEELLTYIKEDAHGYIQQKTINGVDYSLLYRPTDLLVQQELGTNTSEEKINELRAQYGNYLYFNLSMSQNGQELLSTAPKNRNEFGAMVNQLAFGMRDKVHLYTATKDTLEMTDFIYPRMYGMSGATTIMFVYPRDEKILQKAYLNFTIEDLGLYTGEVKFKIPTKVFKHEPQLTFKEKR